MRMKPLVRAKWLKLLMLLSFHYLEPLSSPPVCFGVFPWTGRSANCENAPTENEAMCCLLLIEICNRSLMRSVTRLIQQFSYVPKQMQWNTAGTLPVAVSFWHLARTGLSFGCDHWSLLKLPWRLWVFKDKDCLWSTCCPILVLSNVNGWGFDLRSD